MRISSRRWVAAILAMALVAASLLAAQAPAATQAAPPSLRQLAKRIVDVGIPGAVVLVRDANGLRAGVAGWGDLRAKQRFGPDHRFRVGSLTKTYVATIVLQLAAEGVVGLNDPLERWLPGVVPNGSAITLRQLLNHTSGVYNYTDDQEFFRRVTTSPLAPWTPEQLVAIATRHRPVFPPGTSWSYSTPATSCSGWSSRRRPEPGGRAARAADRRAARSDPHEHADGADARRAVRARVPPAPEMAKCPRLGGGRSTSRRGTRGGPRPPEPSSRPRVRSSSSTPRSSAGGSSSRPSRRRCSGRSESRQPDEYGLGLQKIYLRCGIAWGHGGSVPGYLTLAVASADGSREAVVLVNATPSTERQGSRIGEALNSAFCR